MKSYICALFIALTVLYPAKLPAAPAPEREVSADSVLASVDGEPITLHDLIKRHPAAKRLSIKDLSSDYAARAVLDAMILEQLIHEEAKARKLSTTADEVDRYIDEIAKRNGLTREEFKAALAREKHSYDDYVAHVKTEILRSKIVSGLVRNERGVSQREIEEYIQANPQLAKSGAKLKLSRIVIGVSKLSAAEAKNTLEEVKKKLQNGSSFAELAKEYSEGPEGSDGGSLGVLAEEDLSSTIFEAVFSLEAGHVSEIVESEAGFHLFRVDERYVKKDGPDDQLYNEVRERLVRQKVEEKLHDYFTSELYNSHAVERKI